MAAIRACFSNLTIRHAVFLEFPEQHDSALFTNIQAGHTHSDMEEHGTDRNRYVYYLCNRDSHGWCLLYLDCTRFTVRCFYEARPGAGSIEEVDKFLAKLFPRFQGRILKREIIPLQPQASNTGNPIALAALALILVGQETETPRKIEDIWLAAQDDLWGDAVMVCAKASPLSSDWHAITDSVSRPTLFSRPTSCRRWDPNPQPSLLFPWLRHL